MTYWRGFADRWRIVWWALPALIVALLLRAVGVGGELVEFVWLAAAVFLYALVLGALYGPVRRGKLGPVGRASVYWWAGVVLWAVTVFALGVSATAAT